MGYILKTSQLITPIFREVYAASWTFKSVIHPVRERAFDLKLGIWVAEKPINAKERGKILLGRFSTKEWFLHRSYHLERTKQVLGWQVIAYFTIHLSSRRQSLAAKWPQMKGRAAADIWASACPSTTQNKGGKLRRDRREETMDSRIAIRPTFFKGLLLLSF